MHDFAALEMFLGNFLESLQRAFIKYHASNSEAIYKSSAFYLVLKSLNTLVISSWNKFWFKKNISKLLIATFIEYLINYNN